MNKYDIIYSENKLIKPYFKLKNMSKYCIIHNESNF